MEQNIVLASDIVNAAAVPPEAIVKGCTLVAFAAFSGWNFECSGNGYLTVYRCGEADATRRRLRLDGNLSQQLREIAATTAADDPERTRSVLRLFKGAARATHTSP